MPVPLALPFYFPLFPRFMPPASLTRSDEAEGFTRRVRTHAPSVRASLCFSSLNHAACKSCLGKTVSKLLAISPCVLIAATLAGAILPVGVQAQGGASEQDIEVVAVHGRAIDRSGLALDIGNSAASRLGLSIMDIPGSVEVIDKETITVKGDFSGTAAVTRATGFAASASPGNGGTATSVRGFEGHSSVVNTYDGTRLYIGAGTVNFPADTWTVERVEVLRGPGSVINGVGAIGATVNYLPKKPTLGTISGELDVTAGSNNLVRVAAGSGGGLTDSMGYRVDIVNHRTDGYVDRGEEDRTAIAGSLLLQPGDTLSVTLSIDYADTEAAPYWGTPLVDGEVPDSIRRNNYNVRDGLVEYEDTWPRLHIEWRLNDNVLLRNDTFYMETERHWRNVESYAYNETTGLVDRSFYLEIIHEQEQLGNRSDVVVDFAVAGRDNRLSVGTEFNRMDFSHINNRPYAGATSVDLDNPDPGTWAEGVESATTRDFDSETFQYAVFVDDLLELNEQWSLVAGLRYDSIDHERRDLARSNGETAGEIDAALSDTSWRLGAVFKPVENARLYAQVSTAVDSIESILSASNPELELAEGEQVEVGVKQQFADGKVQYTLALYDITKSDLQSEEFGVTRQVGKQSSRGVEFELFWLALNTLSVHLNLALVDPEYEEFVDGGNDYSGNVPRGVPEETANLWLTWQVTGAWSLAGGARYVGERYLDDANTETLPQYTVWDATVRWQMREDVTLSLRGKNLSDTEDYVLSPYGNQWILGDGRTGELSLNYRF